MADWYAIQTKARQEHIAEHNLVNQDFTTFLPRLKTTRHRRGRWQSLIEPLFPGYLFVELDMGVQNTAPIRSTRGVIRLVRQGNEPRSVPRPLIDDLIRAHQLGGEAIEPAQVFEPGDEVTLIDGPMAGLKAIFKARTSQERVILMLNMLGQDTRVTVSAHHVMPAA